MRRELWFGLSIMLGVVLLAALLMPWGQLENGHLGLLMLALIVVAIMLGFPTAFTLMGMGMIFAFLAYWRVEPSTAMPLTLELMVQRAYSVISNDVLVAVPLFVFMGYLVERANLMAELFDSLRLAMARVPGSLAVATLVTCAVFATATGIVGAVITLMGLLAMPTMLRAGYDARIVTGAIAAGGCLGVLLPPSVLLIVYSATAGVSVMQLYAGAVFPGLLLAGLYIGFVIVLAWWKPALMPPLPASERHIPLGPSLQALAATGSTRVLPALWRRWRATRDAAGARTNAAPAAIAAPSRGPALALALPWLLLGAAFWFTTAGPQDAHQAAAGIVPSATAAGLDLTAPDIATDDKAADDDMFNLAAPSLGDAAATPGASASSAAAPGAAADDAPPSRWPWAAAALLLAVFQLRLTLERLQLMKRLVSSLVPLAVLMAGVLGSIMMGIATPTEAAAVGAFGGALLALAHRRLRFPMLRESVFLTGKTTAMVCWLFVGSAIFSAAFALLGGQEIVERWVLSLGLTPLQFLLLAQVLIFLLGWPLEWTEIIVIFMPIFVPLLDHFTIDPLFFGLLVALNLQTAYLSPPVAMAALYLKGIAPAGVTLNQIFAGMLPYMGLQLLAMLILYTWPSVGLWLPQVLYR